MNPQQVSEVLNETWNETQKEEMLESLDDLILMIYRNDIVIIYGNDI